MSHSNTTPMRGRYSRQTWIALPELDPFAHSNSSARDVSPLGGSGADRHASGSTSRRNSSSEFSSNAFPLLLEGAEGDALIGSNIHDATIATRSSSNASSASTEQLRPTPLAPSVKAELSSKSRSRSKKVANIVIRAAPQSTRRAYENMGALHAPSNVLNYDERCVAFHYSNNLSAVCIFYPEPWPSERRCHARSATRLAIHANNRCRLLRSGHNYDSRRRKAD
jgi:hypothetical protein